MRSAYWGVPPSCARGRAELRSQPSSKQHLVASPRLCSYSGTEAYTQNLHRGNRFNPSPKVQPAVWWQAGICADGKNAIAFRPA